jgi:hypothetical protein
MTHRTQALRAERDRIVRRIEELTREIDGLELLPEFKQQMNFCRAFNSLSKQHGFTPQSALAILVSAAEHITPPRAEHPVTRRLHQKSKIYKHPETSEQLVVHEGRSKLLRMWRQAYGSDVVEGWVIEQHGSTC